MAEAWGPRWPVGLGATGTITLWVWDCKTQHQECWQVLLMEGGGGCSKGFVLLASQHIKQHSYFCRCWVIFVG